MADLITHFLNITDKRKSNGIRHKLIGIIDIAICGADDWVMIEYFRDAKREWFEVFLELQNGILSHDSFVKVFTLIGPQEFQTSFVDWVHEIAEITSGQLIAIDGKTVRRSHDRSKGKEAIHLVSTWASQSGVVLSQVKVDEKSNEIQRYQNCSKYWIFMTLVLSQDIVSTPRTDFN